MLKLKTKILPTGITLLLLATGACRESDYGEDSSESESTLQIGAGVSELLNTRSYEEDEYGNVVGGVFWLTFPSAVSTAAKPNFNRLYVDFSKAVYNERYGRYYNHTEGGQELIWSMVGTAPNPLYLDNVQPRVSTSVNDTVVKFPTENNPYAAGVMTSDNDILWGSLQQTRTSKLLNFDLHHVLAGVRVKIIVDNSEDSNLVDEYDLEKARVYLTNIVSTPITFNRLSGDITLAQSRESLYMIDNLDSSQPQMETELDWESTTIDEEGNVVYLTKVFILPPQTLSEDYWPELVIRFPNPSAEEADSKPYKEFYGKIPKAMFTDYEQSTNYALDLSFLREHILEIRTQLSQMPPQLEFMPVRVYDWVKWGPYTVVGHQVGIYSAQQLLDIINYYNTDNIRMLERFGEVENGYWKFNVFANFSVNLEDIAGKMSPAGHEFGVNFDLHNYQVKVMAGGDKEYVVSTGSALTNLIVNGTLP